jgi:hypothetical protein
MKVFGEDVDKREGKHDCCDPLERGNEIGTRVIR